MINIESVNLTDLQAERKIATATTSKINRLDIERGQQIKVRALAFAFGASKRPWVQFSQHWTGKGRAPINCKTHTHTDFGGDPNYICPVCELVEQGYNAAVSEEEKTHWFKLKSGLTYRIYVLKLEAQDKDGNIQEFNDLSVYEFNMNNKVYAAFSTMLERSCSKGGLGLLDPHNGFDFWVVKGNDNKTRFDREDPSPMFKIRTYNTDGTIATEVVDPEFDIKIKKVWSQIRQPNFTFFDDARMNAIADKIAEGQLENIGQLIKDGYSTKTQSAPLTTTRTAPRGRFAGVQEVDEDAPAAPVRTAVRTQVAVAPVVRRTVPVEVASVPVPQEQDDSNPELSPEVDEAPVVRTTRVAGAVVKPIVTQAVPPPAVAAARRGAVPPPPPARRSPVAVPVPLANVSPMQESVSDEEDTAPEEAVDQAPVIAEEVPEAEIAAPAVSAPSGGALSPALRSRIGTLRKQA